MTFWSKWFERRSTPAWTTAQSLEDYSGLFGGGATASTIVVTPERALQVPAVFGCVQVIMQDLAKTPIRLRRKVGADAYVDAVDHDLFEILHDLANPEMTAYRFKASMMWNLLVYGAAYAEIIRVDGRVAALWPLDPRLMRVDRDDARRKRWTYTGGATTTSWTFDPSQPPILEMRHETPLVRCRELIGTALALQTYTGKFFANGGRLSGVLQSASPLNQESMHRLKDAWKEAFGRPENAHSIAILDAGLEYRPFASANDEAQLNQTVMALNTMIAGAFRVPTWKIGDLSQANYSNMETGELAYITSTLDPFFQLWEDALRRDLLTSRQYGTYTVTFDRSALIRSDVAAQHTALAQGIQAGIYSQNDARRMLGLNPIPDGDRYLVNSALVPVAAVGENSHVA